MTFIEVQFPVQLFNNGYFQLVTLFYYCWRIAAIRCRDRHWIYHIRLSQKIRHKEKTQVEEERRVLTVAVASQISWVTRRKIKTREKRDQSGTWTGCFVVQAQQAWCILFILISPSRIKVKLDNISMRNQKQGCIWPKPSTPSRLLEILDSSIIVIHPTNYHTTLWTIYQWPPLSGQSAWGWRGVRSRYYPEVSRGGLMGSGAAGRGVKLENLWNKNKKSPKSQKLKNFWNKNKSTKPTV